jgi:hypothetical protein
LMTTPHAGGADQDYSFRATLFGGAIHGYH